MGAVISNRIRFDGGLLSDGPGAREFVILMFLDSIKALMAAATATSQAVDWGTLAVKIDVQKFGDDDVYSVLGKVETS